MAYLARALAVDYGPANIRFNVIVPGAINIGTSTLQKAGAHELFFAKIPLQRRALPDDIAGTAVLLGSPSRAHTTGQCVTVVGGQVFHGMYGITAALDFPSEMGASQD